MPYISSQYQRILVALTHALVHLTFCAIKPLASALMIHNALDFPNGLIPCMQFNYDAYDASATAYLYDAFIHSGTLRHNLPPLYVHVDECLHIIGCCAHHNGFFQPPRPFPAARGTFHRRTVPGPRLWQAARRPYHPGSYKLEISMRLFDH